MVGLEFWGSLVIFRIFYVCVLINKESWKECINFCLVDVVLGFFVMLLNVFIILKL